MASRLFLQLCTAGMDKDSVCTVQPPVACFGKLETGIPTCATVTLVDRLVLSRSGFDELPLGRCIWKGAKINSLRVISEHLIAGRWQDVRGPSEKELKATTVLEFSI
jgi:hypothetical protein